MMSACDTHEKDQLESGFAVRQREATHSEASFFTKVDPVENDEVEERLKDFDLELSLRRLALSSE